MKMVRRRRQRGGCRRRRQRGGFMGLIPYIAPLLNSIAISKMRSGK